MAGSAVRTKSVVEACESVLAMAVRVENLAEKYKSEYGVDDLLSRAEQVRAEAYREAVLHLCERLNIDMEEVSRDTSGVA